MRVVKGPVLNFEVLDRVVRFDLLMDIVVNCIETLVADDSDPLIVKQLHPWDEPLNVLHVFLAMMLNTEELNI